MLLFPLIGALLLLVDQFIKYWTVANVELNTGIVNIPGLLHITHVKNFGIAFGLMQNAAWLRWVLFLLMLVVAAAIIYAIIKDMFATNFALLTACLFLAGILGNGIDRVIWGYVVDMLEFKAGNLPIFNLADVLAVGGGIAFFVSILMGGLRKKKEAPAPAYVPAQQPHRVPAQSAQPVRRAPAEGAQPVRRAPAEGAQPVRRAPADGAQPVRRAPAQGQQVVRRPAAAQTAARPAAPGTTPMQRPAAGQRPVATGATPVRRPTAAPVQGQRPAAPQARPVPTPARTATPTTSSDDFDLDAIMAEFK